MRAKKKKTPDVIWWGVVKVERVSHRGRGVDARSAVALFSARSDARVEAQSMGFRNGNRYSVIRLVEKARER